MSAKEQITKIKEYADIADASYALLHYIEENDEAEDWFDNLLNLARKPPAKWIYADGIKRGYEVKEENKTTLIEDNHRSIGQPTAYALAIEARFAKDKLIKLDKNEAPKKIENTIQNFIKRSEDNPALENQEIKVSTQREKMPEEQTSHYLSTRTKTFTSRYEVVEHQKNTSYGFSATLFKDCENNNQLILVCRGTEPTLEDFKTDITLAQGDIPLQCYELARFYEEKIKHHLGEEEKLLVIGHSLGGYLAQSFALMYPHKVKELCTFNAPGILLDWSQDFTEIVLDTLELLTWLIPFGFARKVGWKIFTSMGSKRFVASNLGHSVSLEISKVSFIPQELQSNKPAIQNLINNISSLKNNPNTLPSSLENTKIFHIETTNTLDIQKHSKIWLSENTTQHLGKDIKGKYLFLYVSEEGIASHYLDCTLKTLYFYEYLLQNQNNHPLFLKDSLQESCNALGVFIKVVYQNMYDQIKKEEQENNKEEIRRCLNSISVSCYNSSTAMETKILLQIPNPIIAILDKALFENTLITKEKKQDIKEIQIFEAIAYLQEHNILIFVMQDNTIKAISSNSPLAYLLSIYEFLPFICTNKDNNPLIQNIQDFKSLTQRATSTKIIVFSNHISEKMIEAYKKQTLFYSIETACRIVSKKA